MATTPRQILDAVYARSKFTNPRQITNEPVEMLQAVIRALRGLFAVGARVNPLVFGVKSAPVSYASGWAMPGDVESLFRVEKADGTEVAVVPIGQQDAEPGEPAVYLLGRTFQIAQGTGLTTSDALTFCYSKRPADPADLNSPLDPLWIESFNELLILELCVYLAIKDKRTDELAAFRDERDRWARLYVAHLEHVIPIERRLHAKIRTIYTHTLVPLEQLFAGGANLAGA